MLTATEYLGNVGIGATGPDFFRADDGNIYVVKEFRNLVGKNVLINEMIAAGFGYKLKLPFPQSALIHLHHFSPERNTAESIGFASRYIADAVYATNENIAETANLSAMAGVLLFDHFFHNADRTNNRKNLLIAMHKKEKHIYAIDHSHLFRTGRWTPDTLQQISERICIYTNFLYGVLLRNYLTPADFQPYIQRIKAMSKADIDNIVNTVPTVWFEHSAEKAACILFIETRCRQIDAITDAIFSKIPNKKYLKTVETCV